MRFTFTSLFYMKFSLLFSALFLFCSGVHAQESETSVRDVFKSKRYWEIGLNHGFVRPTINPVSGPHKAYSITGRVFDLGLGYTFNASEKIGLTAIGNLGAYPMLVGIPPTNYSFGKDTKQYFHWVSYTGFAELAATATYRHFLNPVLALVSGGGLGAKFVVPTSSGNGMGSSWSNSSSYYSLENTGEAKPFLVLQTGLQYKLKNSDLLGLRLSYHHSLKAVQEGTYYIASNSPEFSQGTIEVKGHQVTLGLNYVFTGYQKLQRRMASEKVTNQKELKRAWKREYFEKRQGKSSAVRIYGALFADQNTSTDAHEIIGSYRPESLGAGLDFSREFRANYFWEAGFNLHEFRHGNTINYPGLLGGGGSSGAFDASQLNVGAGYILRRKNLVPLFYLSGGAALAYTDRMKGLVGYSEFRSSTIGSSDFLEAHSDNYLLRKTFPLLYAGLRKDFRIRGKLFFSPSFRYYQGLLKVHEMRMQYTTNQTFPDSRRIDVFMRGSYFQYSLGLKLDL
jgi:hypothetical protein